MKNKKTKLAQPTKDMILATANLGISEAVEGLAKANNPYVVAVRDQLNELEVKIAVMVGERNRVIKARVAAKKS